MSKRRAGKPKQSSLPAQKSSFPEQSTPRSNKELRAIFRATSGPLPDPDVLREYEQTLPGAAERVFVMAENEATYRHTATFRALEAEESITRRGQWCGLSLGIGGLLASLMSLYLGSAHVAGIIGGGTTLGLVTAFVGSRLFGQQKEDNKK